MKTSALRPYCNMLAHEDSPAAISKSVDKAHASMTGTHRHKYTGRSEVSLIQRFVKTAAILAPAEMPPIDSLSVSMPRLAAFSTI